jgi:lactate dehydrogenase-like 2-hydroxyacid dehydrogenase
MTEVLIIGTYAEMDITALRAEFGGPELPTLADLDKLSPAERAPIRAVACKSHEAFGPAQMDRLPALELIARYGVGYEAVDLAAAAARGITVTNTPDVLNDDVADLAVGMWLALLRDMERGILHVRSGAWAAGGPPLARKATGRRVGILGMGRIGRELADRLAAFKCAVHYSARSPKTTPAAWQYHADPVALATAVDDLFVTVVGGAQTGNMIDAGVLTALGPDGHLINMSRGSVVDEAALLSALQSGIIRGAALDVFRNEPRPDPRLTGLPNVLPMPHVGTATIETRADMGALQRANIRALLAGQPLLTPVPLG